MIEEGWVEVKLWIVEKSGQRVQVKMRGILREIEINHEAVMMGFGDLKEYTPAASEGVLRWLQKPWKMWRGAPIGFHRKAAEDNP